MMLGQLEVIGAVAPPPLAVSSESALDASYTAAQATNAQKYHAALSSRTSPPASITEALELEVMRLRGGVLPSQRDSLLRNTPAAGPPQRYQVHYSDSESESAADPKKQQKHSTWRWPSILRAGPAESTEAMGESGEEAAKQKALCHTAHDLLTTLGQSRAKQLHLALARNFSSMRQSNALGGREHGGSLSSLATWPESGLLLASIPTGTGGPCAESVLYPKGLLPAETPPWHAPLGTNKVDFHIVLPRMSSLMTVRLTPGSLPYGAKDTPTVKISLGIVLSDLVEAKLAKIVPLETGEIDFELEAPMSCCIVAVSLEIATGSATEPCEAAPRATVEAPAEASVTQPTSSHYYEQKEGETFAQVKVGSGTSATNSEDGPAVLTSASPPTSGANNNSGQLVGLLRVGRLKLLGKLLAVKDETRERTLTEAEKSQHKQIMEARPPTVRQLYKPAQQQDLEGKGVELRFNKVVARGFTLTVLHGEQGPDAQVRVMDVTLYTHGDSAGHGERKVHIGRFHVPKTRHEQQLYFDFSPVEQVTRCMFDYVASYGAHPCTVGNITLHC